ncbi:MAG: C_GCAxxG_C_C family protein [Desulfobacteraceae bacterium]|nr:MAG: C_GCAxxG_C_C family protein [Desulfobacteraceae bacterium]
MADYEALKARVKELAGRDWDVPEIEARAKKLEKEGFPPKILKRDEMLADKQQILDRVQQRAEEYNFILKNCAQGTAMALQEEFGLGNMEIIKALTPVPGIGATGQVWVGITGSLIVFGLYFGSDDRLDVEAIGATIVNAQKFMALFEDELGHRLCAEIHEHAVFGRYMDPGASEEHMAAFAEAKGFEKCGLAAGIGARLAAGFMIDSMA